MKTSTLLKSAGILLLGLCATRIQANEVEVCQRNLIIFRTSLDLHENESALTHFHEILKDCPASSEKFYQEGASLLKEMIKETTGERKESLIDSLLFLYDQRIEHFGKEGYLTGLKGIDLLAHKSEVAHEANQMLSHSIELKGIASKASVIDAFFRASVLELRQGKIDTLTLAERFEAMGDLLDAQNREFGPSSTRNKVQRNLRTLGIRYIQCDKIQQLKASKFELRKTDADWLKRTNEELHLFHCEDDQFRQRIMAEMILLDPSVNGWMTLYRQQVGSKRFDLALESLEQAIKLEGDNAQKAELILKQAAIHFNQKQFDQTLRDCEQALRLNSKNGEAHRLMAEVFAQKALKVKDAFDRGTVYWVIDDILEMALQLELDDKHRKDAESLQTKVRRSFPEKRDLHWKSMGQGTEFKVGHGIERITIIRAREE